MTAVRPDVVILGGGPGGYVAAIRGAQLGLRVVLVEREAVGGVCLNWGCIPTKALLRGAEVLELVRRAAEFGVETGAVRADLGPNVDRSREVVRHIVSGVESLLARHGVNVVRAAGRLVNGGRAVEAGGETLEAAHVILATGARPRALPAVPFDGDRVLDSRAALALREAPRSVVIVGGGCVGVEFAYLYRTYGVEVTLVEQDVRVLGEMDADTVSILQRRLVDSGVRLLLGARVDALDVGPAGVRARVAAGAGESSVEAERVLVAIGIEANTGGLGLEEAGVALTSRGFVQVDEYCRTSRPGVYAIGDVTGIMPLAHVASAHGVLAVEHIAGLDPAPLDHDWMPRAVYCSPQIAGVGLTEAAALARGRELAIGRVPFGSNGKALALGASTGLAKLIADARTGELLGFHAVGEGATELIAEVGVARTLESTPFEVGRTVHAHPTLSELVREAALATSGEAIHFHQPARAPARDG